VGARLLKGLGSGCDEAALEVVRKMPKWKAGKANGQIVRSEVSVKVPFQ
jgi:periplasmic protein TonB